MKSILKKQTRTVSSLHNRLWSPTACHLLLFSLFINLHPILLSLLSPFPAWIHKEVEVKSEEKVLVAQSRLTLQPHGLQPTRLLGPRDSPGKNTGVGSHSLLQGIFLTQGSNLGLLNCRQILYHLSHQGSPIMRLIQMKTHEGKVKEFFQLKSSHAPAFCRCTHHAILSRPFPHLLSST